MHVTLKGIPFTRLATTLSFYSHSIAKTVRLATLTYLKRAGIPYNASMIYLLSIGILIFVEANMKKVKHVKLRILEVILIDLPYYTANIDRMTKKPLISDVFSFYFTCFYIIVREIINLFLTISNSHSLHTKSETPCESKSFRFLFY
jgi:hypothetical protein